MPAPKITDEAIRATLIEAARLGLYEYEIAAVGRIHVHTLDRWQKRGEEADAILADGGAITDRQEQYRSFALDFRAARTSPSRKARRVLINLLDSEEEMVRLRAAQELLKAADSVRITEEVMARLEMLERGGKANADA